MEVISIVDSINASKYQSMLEFLLNLFKLNFQRR